MSHISASSALQQTEKKTGWEWYFQKYNSLICFCRESKKTKLGKQRNESQALQQSNHISKMTYQFRNDEHLRQNEIIYIIQDSFFLLLLFFYAVFFSLLLLRCRFTGYRLTWQQPVSAWNVMEVNRGNHNLTKQVIPSSTIISTLTGSLSNLKINKGRNLIHAQRDSSCSQSSIFFFLSDGWSLYVLTSSCWSHSLRYATL